MPRILCLGEQSQNWWIGTLQPLLDRVEKLFRRGLCKKGKDVGQRGPSLPVASCEGQNLSHDSPCNRPGWLRDAPEACVTKSTHHRECVGEAALHETTVRRTPTEQTSRPSLLRR